MQAPVAPTLVTATPTDARGQAGILEPCFPGPEAQQGGMGPRTTGVTGWGCRQAWQGPGGLGAAAPSVGYVSPSIWKVSSCPLPASPAALLPTSGPHGPLPAQHGRHPEGGLGHQTGASGVCFGCSLEAGRETLDPTWPPAWPASLWERALGSRACPVLHQLCFICYFCLIHHKGPGTCVVAFRDVVLCFTMLNGQMPFVCFLFNPVFVRTIFSEAALINNGCAAHVSALLIFYAAAAPTTLSALLGR